MQGSNNDAGRFIPSLISGYGKTRPFRYENKYEPHLQKRVPTTDKIPSTVKDLPEAIALSGLKDGMRISFHHHLRLGDLVVGLVLEQLEALGFRDLVLCSSSLMGPACASVLRAVQAKVVARIETTGLKEPLTDAVLQGEIPQPVIFRSHGGRARAIEAGEIPIDVAFLAASAIDGQGNLYGCVGKNPFGSMGYAHPDAQYAKTVIAITDSQVEGQSLPISIPSKWVDLIVEVPAIGDARLIGGGSLRISQNPLELVIATQALGVLQASNVIRSGFNYQAGSGGISLLVTMLLSSYMQEHHVMGGFASGGITESLVAMAQQGLFQTLYDVQSFDTGSAASLAGNPFHKEMGASQYANPYYSGCIAHALDVMILSATEVDLDFHVNSITGTNGRILGALGGGPDTAYGAKLTVVVMPSFRGRIPMVHEHVNLVCTPGGSVDVVVSERGVAVNPLRPDLLALLQASSLRVVPIRTLMEQTYMLTGRPDFPLRTGKVVAAVEYRDGTIIDCLWRH